MATAENTPTIDLSIILASYNTIGLTRGCLQSIFANTAGITFEVIVVDDCSKDGSPEMVEQEFPQVHVIRNTQNLRYAKTNNAGLRCARGRYGLLLNSDTEVQLGAFSTLVKFMDDHPEVAAAGPKLINPDGSIQHCIRSFPGLLPMIAQSVNLHTIWPGNPFTNKYYNTDFDYSMAQRVESIGTTAFIIRRSTWETFGMLDERFTLAFVDLAYCFMLGQHNQPIYYVPDAVVLHYGSQSINQNGISEIRFQHYALGLFYEIFYAPKQDVVTRNVTRAGIRARYHLKVIEHKLSKDKRLIKGPGAPQLR